MYLKSMEPPWLWRRSWERERESVERVRKDEAAAYEICKKKKAERDKGGETKKHIGTA